MPAHHIRDHGWGLSHPVIAQTNQWLDGLRARGDYGRLLAARGHLDAWVASMQRVGRRPEAWQDVVADDIAGYLAAAAPVGVVRGEASFARQAGPVLERWSREAPVLSRTDAEALQARVVEGGRVQRDVLRTQDALEILLWQHFSDRPPQAPSQVAGWLETLSVGDATVTLQPLAAAVVEGTQAALEAVVPSAACARWRVGDLAWLDLSASGTRPMAVGAILPAAGRPWLEAAGWPGAPLYALPTEVQARFTGDGAPPWPAEPSSQ